MEVVSPKTVLGLPSPYPRHRYASCACSSAHALSLPLSLWKASLTFFARDTFATVALYRSKSVVAAFDARFASFFPHAELLNFATTSCAAPQAACQLPTLLRSIMVTSCPQTHRKVDRNASHTTTPW